MGNYTHLIIAVVLFGALLVVIWYFSKRAHRSETENIEGLRDVADRGDVYSQFRLGQLYYEGTGVGRDDQEAAKWFLKAAGHDHAEAQYILASMYEKGSGVKKSDEEAFHWYLQAAGQGHERASVILDAEKWMVFKKKHLSGKEPVVPESAATALESRQDSEAERPCPAAGEAPCPDAHGQVMKYLAKAQAGDMDAQYNLGIMYYHGEGVGRDHAEALKWFHLAAEQNDPEAQYNLGFMYGRGEGTEKNHRLSMEWFQKAAAQGHAGAREILEKMFKKA